MSRAPLFVTRKFPPSVGGMETLAAGVWRSIRHTRPDALLLAHGGKNTALVWWLPLTVLRVLGLILRRRVELVLTGDALTYAVLWPVLKLARVPSATMVMGLDVTFDNGLYRALTRPPLRDAAHVLAISAATAEQSVAAGVSKARVTVVRLGVEEPALSSLTRQDARHQVRARLGLPDDAVLLLTLGRLVPRKGVRWFAAEVLPGLPPSVHYVVAGDGPDAEALRSAGDRVHLVGRVPDEEREQLLRGCDLFVQPNIAVPGDMEGFGLVTVEAAMRDLTVVAADLEGIKDAVVDGVTGVLVPSGEAPAWLAVLGPLLATPKALEAQGLAYGEKARTLYSEAQMGEALCAALGLSPLDG